MNDIPLLEQRIAVALERIRAGVDTISAAQTNSAQTDALQADVARLETRQSELEVALKAAEAGTAAARDQLAAVEAEKAEMLAAVQKLQAVNSDLRVAAAESVSDPDAINRALVADLEALQAARAADLRDIEALLAELEPIAKEA